MPDAADDNLKQDVANDELVELDLTDADILDAMQHISGYLDISTDDFRKIYHLAHRHAIARLLGSFRANNLMRAGFQPLLADMSLGAAAQALVDSGYKALPVVDQTGHVIGMLTETDFLRQLKTDTWIKMLLNKPADDVAKQHWDENRVSAAMSSPAVTVKGSAGFQDVIGAFKQHVGRSIPVVSHDGQLLGLLFRKDFFAQLENIR